MLIFWVIKRSKSGTTHRHTFRNFTHPVWSICDLSDHELFWIIRNPGRQKRITLSVDSISTIPWKASTSYVKIWERGQHYSNLWMPCIISIFARFQATWYQPNETPGALFRCPANIFSNVTNCEIPLPAMIIAETVCQVSNVGCTNDWYNCPSCRNLIVCIAPPIACVHLIQYSAIF